MVGGIARGGPRAAAALGLVNLDVGSVALLPHHHRVAGVVQDHFSVDRVRVAERRRANPAAAGALAFDLVNLVLGSVVLLPHHHRVAGIVQGHFRVEPARSRGVEACRGGPAAVGALAFGSEDLTILPPHHHRVAGIVNGDVEILGKARCGGVRKAETYRPGPAAVLALGLVDPEVSGAVALVPHHHRFARIVQREPECSCYHVGYRAERARPSPATVLALGLVDLVTCGAIRHVPHHHRFACIV